MTAPRFLVDGVPEGGVLVGDIGSEVPESVICSYFGPRSSKSGWKYQHRTSPEEQTQILSLYRRVYECNDIPNKEITVQFARGLILQSEGTKVDWEEFRVSRRKYRESIRKKKELTRQFVKSEGEGPAPSIIGKRRCLATQGVVGDDLPTSLKLTVKSEGVGEGLVAAMGKRGGGKCKPHNASPGWTSSDIDDMLRVITAREVLLESFRVSLGEVTKVRGEKEDSLRRARLMREDRTVMIAEGQIEIERIDAEELSIRARMEETSLLLESLGSGNSSFPEKDTLLAQNLVDEGKCEALSISRVDEMKSGRRLRQIVTDCNLTISRLEKELGATCEEHKKLNEKVEALQKQASGMEEQLKSMREGFGVSLWPMPIAECPLSPVHSVHTLNACPVCHLWYSCWDYVPIGCGHVYHPWCLAEHAKVSDKCLLPDCGKLFLRLHQAALGIRTPVKNSTVSVKKEVITASHSFPATKDRRKDSGVVSSCEEGERLTLGSQASETNVPTASNGCPPMEEIAGASTCHLCKTKPQACRLKACGHDTFCFGCVNGLGVCPTCKEPVSGWEAKPKSRPVPTVADRVAVASTSESEGVGNRGTVAMALNSEDRADIDEGGEYSDEDDNCNDGLVHYCDDELFSQGGVRSVSIEGLLQKGAEAEVLLSTEDGGLKETAATSRKLQTEKTLAPEMEGGKEPAGALKNKQSGKKVGDDSMNHTRIVKRTMNEILGLATEEEPPKKRPGRPRSVVKKQSLESLAQGLRVSRNGSVRQTVPAKFRDM